MTNNNFDRQVAKTNENVNQIVKPLKIQKMKTNYEMVSPGVTELFAQGAFWMMAENGKYVITLEPSRVSSMAQPRPVRRRWQKLMDLHGGCLQESKNYYRLMLKVPKKFGLHTLMEFADNASLQVRAKMPLWLEGEATRKGKVVKMRKRRGNAA